jgi:hypothetical protein
MDIQPFTALTPDAVLAAPDSIGLRCDGRFGVQQVALWLTRC